MSKLIEMIKHHEGVVPHAYQDSRGYWTIGVGRLIDESLGGGNIDGELGSVEVVEYNADFYEYDDIYKQGEDNEDPMTNLVVPVSSISSIFVR